MALEIVEAWRPHLVKEHGSAKRHSPRRQGYARVFSSGRYQLMVSTGRVSPAVSTSTSTVEMLGEALVLDEKTLIRPRPWTRGFEMQVATRSHTHHELHTLGRTRITWGLGTSGRQKTGQEQKMPCCLEKTMTCLKKLTRRRPPTQPSPQS